MTGISHGMIGISTTLALVTFVPATPEQYLVSAIIGLIASLLPDLDANNSLLQVWLVQGKGSPWANKLISWRQRQDLFTGLIHAILAALEITIRSLIWLVIDLLKHFTKHRGITHSLMTLVVLMPLFVAASTLLGWHLIYSIAFAIGYLSHILADATTVSGVQLLYPFSQESLHILPKRFHYKTSSLQESLLTLTICLVSLLITAINMTSL